MAEPKIGRLAFIQNPFEQWRQLGITHHDKAVEGYLHAALRDMLDKHNSVLSARRKRRERPPARQ
jgi:hypothetical protein